jgi:hypothetical protein
VPSRLPILACAVLALGLAMFGPPADTSGEASVSSSSGRDRVGICHATGSAQNPYVFVSLAPDAAAALIARGDKPANSPAACLATTPTPSPTRTATQTGVVPERTPQPTLTPSLTPVINACLTGQQFIADELIQGFHPGQSYPEIQDPIRLQAVLDAEQRAGVISRIELFRLPTGAVYLLKLRAGSDLCPAMDILRALPEVRFVEPNFTGGV